MIQQASERGELINEARKAAFSSPLLDHYMIERISDEGEFWKYYSDKFYQDYAVDLYFSEKNLRTKTEALKLGILNKPNKEFELTDNLLIKDGGGR